MTANSNYTCENSSNNQIVEKFFNNFRNLFFAQTYLTEELESASMKLLFHAVCSRCVATANVMCATHEK